MLVAWNTFNIFLLTVISNIIFFFITKKNNVVFTRNTMISLLHKSWLSTQKNMTQTNLLNTNTIDFHLREQRMSALFLELARTVLFLSSSPHTFEDWGWSPQWWPLPHMEKWQNSFCGEASHTQAYCVCWWCCLGWTSCQTHAGKHDATVLPNLCWLGICKDLAALSQTLQEWTLSLSLVLCPLTLIPSSNNMISLTSLPSIPAGPVTSRWAPLFICSLMLILVLKII